jgi:hypothetical protein
MPAEKNVGFQWQLMEVEHMLEEEKDHKGGCPGNNRSCIFYHSLGVVIENIQAPNPSSLKTSTSGPLRIRLVASYTTVTVDLNTVAPPHGTGITHPEEDIGHTFVTNKKSKILRSADPAKITKALIKEIVSENFISPCTTNFQGGGFGLQNKTHTAQTGGCLP